MRGDRVSAPVPSNEETLAYIADMVEQMARLADAVGDRELAASLREAVADYVCRLDVPAARTDA